MRAPPGAAVQGSASHPMRVMDSNGGDRTVVRGSDDPHAGDGDEHDRRFRRLLMKAQTVQHRIGSVTSRATLRGAAW